MSKIWAFIYSASAIAMSVWNPQITQFMQAHPQLATGTALTLAALAHNATPPGATPTGTAVVGTPTAG